MVGSSVVVGAPTTPSSPAGAACSSTGSVSDHGIVQVVDRRGAARTSATASMPPMAGSRRWTPSTTTRPDRVVTVTPMSAWRGMYSPSSIAATDAAGHGHVLEQDRRDRPRWAW